MSTPASNVKSKLDRDLDRAFGTIMGDGDGEENSLSPREIYDTLRDAYGENGKNDDKIKEYLRDKKIHI